MGAASISVNTTRHPQHGAGPQCACRNPESGAVRRCGGFYHTLIAQSLDSHRSHRHSPTLERVECEASMEACDGTQSLIQAKLNCSGRQCAQPAHSASVPRRAVPADRAARCRHS